MSEPDLASEPPVEPLPLAQVAPLLRARLAREWPGVRLRVSVHGAEATLRVTCPRGTVDLRRLWAVAGEYRGMGHDAVGSGYSVLHWLLPDGSLRVALAELYPFEILNPADLQPAPSLDARLVQSEADYILVEEIR